MASKREAGSPVRVALARSRRARPPSPAAPRLAWAAASACSLSSQPTASAAGQRRSRSTIRVPDPHMRFKKRSWGRGWVSSTMAARADADQPVAGLGLGGESGLLRQGLGQSTEGGGVAPGGAETEPGERVRRVETAHHLDRRQQPPEALVAEERGGALTGELEDQERRLSGAERQEVGQGTAKPEPQAGPTGVDDALHPPGEPAAQLPGEEPLEPGQDLALDLPFVSARSRDHATTPLFDHLGYPTLHPGAAPRSHGGPGWARPSALPSSVY